MNDGLTIYVYDENTGKIQYTVDNVVLEQIQSFRNKNTPFYLGPPRGQIVGTYIEKNANTGAPSGISSIRSMDFLSVDKIVIVANGIDEATVSGLKKGMHVNINNEYSYTVDDKTGTTLEISSSNFSYIPHHNELIIGVSGYGYYDSRIKINMIEEGE